MIDMKKTILIITILISISCNNKSNQILGNVLQDYKRFEYEMKIFDSSPYVSPIVILYKAKMDLSDYQGIINNPEYIPNCIEFSGERYENMRDNTYPFDVSEIEWWKPVYSLKPDFVGHYDFEKAKFTDCSESRQYRFAYKYFEGNCYLIIENTLQDM